MASWLGTCIRPLAPLITTGVFWSGRAESRAMLAALELGSPPAAPPLATANNAVGGGVGGTFHGAMPQKDSRICAYLGLDARSSLSAAVAAANESTGVAAAEGGLLQQVDRLIASLFGGPQGGAPGEVR